MRIVCPSCSAIYEVPDHLLGTGKRLRCARCAHEWLPPEFARAPEPIPPLPAPVPAPALALPPPAATKPEPAALHANPKPRVSHPAKPSRVPVLIALAASSVVLTALLAAGFIWRAALMQIFPPSQRLFAWLGQI